MRISGRARLKLRTGEEFDLDLAASEFVFRTTWEPSLDVIDIYGASVCLGVESVPLEFLESSGPFGGTPTLRVRPGSAPAAELVSVDGLGKLLPDAPFPSDPARALPQLTREAHIAAYHEACEAVATAGRAAVAAHPDQRDERVLEAVERMAAIPRRYSQAHTAAARQLFFDTGYYETDVIPVPDGLTASALVAVMLRFDEEHRGVDVHGADGLRTNYRAHPHELSATHVAHIARVDVCVQFSTRGPGGTRPGVVYDRSAGGFLFDGPRAARDAFRATIMDALREQLGRD